MGKQTQIDFTQIRPLEGDRRKGFEELVCQLARRQPPKDAVAYRRVEGSGGDGGVEAYWVDTTNHEHGVQAKYFLATKDIDWAQVDKSVKTALDLHPTLQSYVVAFACDLTDRSGLLGRGKTGWEHWINHKKRWEDLARAKGMKVAFSAWTKSTIIDDLASHADWRGLALFWFDSDVLDEKRLAALFERARADLGERFHPEDNVRTALAEAFQGMRRSSAFIRKTADWFKNVPSSVDFDISASRMKMSPPLALMTALRDAIDGLHGVGVEIESIGMKPFRTAEWQAVINAFSKAFGELLDHFDKQEKGDEREELYTSEARRNLHILRQYVNSGIPLFGYADHEKASIAADRTRFIVVQGEPGSGKSHLFADAISSSLSENSPAILILGQNFFGDIRKSFLQGLGMPGQDFEVALQALDTAGELTGRRTLLLIDALNEASDLRLWPNELAGLASELLKFDHISFGVSLRPEYLEVLLPESVRKSAKIFTHRGIDTPEEQEQAAVQYFEKRGITRPTVPWLAPEFSNFLFLRTVCDAIALSGSADFPRGLRGSLDILRLYLDSIDKKIRKEFPGASVPKDAVAKSARDIAAWMAARKRDSIDLAAAAAICATTFGSSGPAAQRSWFNVLTSEGVFRKDHILPTSGDFGEDPFAHIEEAYRFSYQRFSDHLIVRSLLADVTDAKAAFATGGKLSYLYEDKDWRWNSLWQAVAVQIPERFPNVEIFDVVTSAPHDLIAFLSEAFEQSLLWRSPTAFSERTLDYFNGEGGVFVRNQTETLLKLATVKDHPWNADFLHRNLKRRALAERDATWSVYLNDNAASYGESVSEIINWCLNAPIEKADEETLRLAAITLSWFFTTSRRHTRDTATKALVRVLAVCHGIVPGLLEHFNSVNDLYVLERVCAGIYGATARTTDKKVIEAAAAAIYDCIFDREYVPLDLSLRDYAKGVIDYAVSQSCLPPTVELAKCRGPHKSVWPLEIPTEEEVAKIVEAAGDKQIYYSAGGMGDFARYEIEPAVGHFTNVPLTQGRPLNPQEKKVKFEMLIQAWPPAIQAAYQTFDQAYVDLKGTMKIVRKEDDRVSFTIEYDVDAEARCEKAEFAFFALLDDRQRAEFDGLMMATFYPHAVPPADRNIPHFDAESAKRWVAANAYGRGWTKERFPDDNYYNGIDRARPKIERIGKKYEWLALSELQARLSDNVWTIKRYPEEAQRYDHPADNWFVRDVEPSFLYDKPNAKLAQAWWLNGAEPLDRFAGRVEEWPFSEKAPTGSNWLNITDPQGVPWLVLYSMWMEREQRDKEKASSVSISITRDVFVRISSIIVDEKVADAVVTQLKGQRLADPSGHETVDWTDGPFLLEYPWRNTWGTDSDYQDEGWRSFESVKYIRPVARQVWESPLDASLPDGSSVCVPNPWIGKQLAVRPDLDQLGSCKNEKGEVIFFDPAYGTDRSASCLVQPKAFFEFLGSKGLECIWIVAGERNAYPSGHHGDYHRRSFAAFHRFKNGRWVSEEWSIDDSGGRVADSSTQ